MNDEPSIFLGYHIFTWSAKPFFVRACEFGREWLWRVAGWRVLRGVAACATRSLPKKKGWVLLRLKNWTQNTHEYTGFVPKNRVAQKQRWVICFTYGVPSFSHRFPCPEPGVWCPLICWPHMWVTWSAAFDAADLFELLDLPQVGFVCIDVQQLYIYTYIARVWQLWYIYINNNNNNSNNNNNNDNMCIYLIYIYTYIYLTNPFAPIRIPHIFGLWLRRVLDSELGVHLSLKGLLVSMFLHSIQQPGIWSSQVACIILAYVILSPSRSIVYIYILYVYIIWYHFTSKKYRSYQFIFNNAHTYTYIYIYTIIYIYRERERQTESVTH